MPRLKTSNEERVYCDGVNPIKIDPVYWDEWDQEPEAPVAGWLLPPIASAIWAAVFTKQSNNLFLDLLYRANQSTSVFEVHGTISASGLNNVRSHGGYGLARLATQSPPRTRHGG